MITEEQMQRLQDVMAAVGELAGKVRVLEEICNKSHFAATAMIETGANAVPGAVSGPHLESIFVTNYATALAGVDEAMLTIWRPAP